MYRRGGVIVLAQCAGLAVRFSFRDARHCCEAFRLSSFFDGYGDMRCFVLSVVCLSSSGNLRTFAASLEGRGPARFSGAH